MTIIVLSNEFLPDVVSGGKATTIRWGRRDYRLGNAVLRTEDRDVAIDILQIRYSRLRDLTDDDARRDGFKGVNELKTVLFRFYPQLQSDDDLTIVEFVTKDPPHS